ncbi:uncharacterized protein LOC122644968 [Telopea speciosissima]|uniref:uncharacterized protein LOC122644968 n=1 Tax=Telopea speciosissima TaxID=54955 RepID=UPI001CC7194A|nr:uncharacterized protein LOC122644968 [Telopea speciosissima]
MNTQALYGTAGILNLWKPKVDHNFQFTLSHIWVHAGPEYSQSNCIEAGWQDFETGNWLLLWGENSEMMGYWPKELFNHLRNKAEGIHWGGETYGPRPYPEMGSGHFPEEGYGKACCISKIRITDEHRVMRDVDISETRSHSDLQCYKIIVTRSVKQGIEIYFGGPGGNCQSTLA